MSVPHTVALEWVPGSAPLSPVCLDEDRDQYQAAVNTIVKLLVS
jgi:hypothetical protein